MDIYGFVTLMFTPDQGALQVLGPLEYGGSQDVDLYVDRDGSPKDCLPVNLALPKQAVDTLCQSLIETAKVRIPDWYALPSNYARLGVKLATPAPATHEVVSSVPDGKAGGTVKFDVYRLTRESGAVDQCRVSFDGSDMKFAEKDMVLVCELFRTDETWRAQSCRAKSADSAGPLTFSCKVAIRLVDPAADRYYVAFAWPDGRSRTPRYLPRLSHEYPDLLTSEAGITPESARRINYPTRALREGLAGRVEMVAGIGNDGRVRSCRPIGTSGHVILDNDSCNQLVRSARFAFVRNAGDFDGLKYQVVAIRWTLPK
ncbi:MAG: energy transducer TonB [Sphingomonadaceae bacterium]|nr:energy transducer TonB [Sphingomonadaceae bacterium]